MLEKPQLCRTFFAGYMLLYIANGDSILQPKCIFTLTDIKLVK